MWAAARRFQAAAPLSAPAGLHREIGSTVPEGEDNRDGSLRLSGVEPVDPGGHRAGLHGEAPLCQRLAGQAGAGP